MALKIAFLGIAGLDTDGDVGYRLYSGNTPEAARVTDGIIDLGDGWYSAEDAPTLSEGQHLRWDSLSEPDALAREYYEPASSGGGGVGSDPLENEVPGDYEVGSAGWALGRLRTPEPSEAPLEPVPIPETPGMVYVRCTADRKGVKFTLTPTDNEKDFILDEYRSVRHYSGYTALSGGIFQVLIEVPPSSVLSTSGFDPATYEVKSNDDTIGTITVPDEGGNLKTLLEASA